MINQVKNILLLGLLAVFLTSCGSGVQEIAVTTVAQEKTPLNIPDPGPLELGSVEWIILTKNNAAEIFEAIKAAGGEAVVFAITDEGYEQLSLNFSDIRNLIAEQRQIIVSYKEYYEPVDEVEQ
jgi:hypothetical protein